MSLTSSRTPHPSQLAPSPYRFTLTPVVAIRANRANRSSRLLASPYAFYVPPTPLPSRGEQTSIADYINGRAFKPEEWETKGKPIIRIQNLNNDTIPYNYSSKTHEPKYQVKTGNLLFAWAASLGVYIWEGGDAWLNQHIFKVLPKPVIIKEYLYYLLQAKIHDLYTKTHGSGMVHITRAIFMSESVLLPPIKEQQRIVSAIKAYYALLDKVAASLN